MPESAYPQEPTLCPRSQVCLTRVLQNNQQGPAGLRHVVSYPGRDGGRSSEERRLPRWSEKLPKDEWHDAVSQAVGTKSPPDSLHSQTLVNEDAREVRKIPGVQ